MAKNFKEMYEGFFKFPEGVLRKNPFCGGGMVEKKLDKCYSVIECS